MLKQFAVVTVLMLWLESVGTGAFVRRAFAAGDNDRAAGDGGGQGVHAAMRNVDFHLTDRIVVHIQTLDGKLVPTQPGQVPVMDDKRSFVFDVDSSSLTLSTVALANDLNDYVFAQPGAPLKKLEASVKGDELVVKGVLARKGGIPFESDGTVTLRDGGMIRVHTNKVKAAGIPVKGLMDLLGIETQNLLNTKKVEGVSVDKDDLVLDPQEILPPPAIRGRLSGIRLVDGAIALTFGSGRLRDVGAETTGGCSGRNFIAFKGGALRFGRLTMNDADLELVDLQPGDAFDFSLDHYAEQLAAGYAKTNLQGGLCAHVPDFGKLKSGGKSAGQ